MQSAATQIGLTAPSTTTKVYLIDFDFESNETKRDYNSSDGYRSLLISAAARFFVRDETYTKIFRVEHNGSFLVVGDNDEKVTSGTANRSFWSWSSWYY